MTNEALDSRRNNYKPCRRARPSSTAHRCCSRNSTIMIGNAVVKYTQIMQQEGLTCREKSSFERPCSQSGFRIQTKRRRNCRVRFQRCWCGGSDGRGWSVRLKGASKGSHLTTSNAKTVPTCDRQRDALPVRELRSALGALCSPCFRGNVCRFASEHR